jgi:hypothetical protein
MFKNFISVERKVQMLKKKLYAKFKRMTESDEIWSKLNQKYGNSVSESKPSVLNYDKIVKSIGMLACALCIYLIYNKYKNTDMEDFKEMLGDTSPEAILKSSVFSLVYIVSDGLFSETIIKRTQELNSKLEKTSLNRAKIPSKGVSLIVALLLGELAELLVDYLKPEIGVFNYGHIPGTILSVIVNSVLVFDNH